MTIIARYEVHQRRSDTPRVCHCWTASLPEARAHAQALSASDGGIAYVKDTTNTDDGWSRVVEKWVRGARAEEEVQA